RRFADRDSLGRAGARRAFEEGVDGARCATSNRAWSIDQLHRFEPGEESNRWINDRQSHCRRRSRRSRAKMIFSVYLCVLCVLVVTLTEQVTTETQRTQR